MGKIYGGSWASLLPGKIEGERKNIPLVQRIFPPTVNKIKTLIGVAFEPLGQIAVNWGLRVAQCESGYNPYALNPSGASGLFQFKPATYAGNGGINIWDFEEQIRIARLMYSENQQYQWACT